MTAKEFDSLIMKQHFLQTFYEIPDRSNSIYLDDRFLNTLSIPPHAALSRVFSMRFIWILLCSQLLPHAATQTHQQFKLIEREGGGVGTSRQCAHIINVCMSVCLHFKCVLLY